MMVLQVAALLWMCTAGETAAPTPEVRRAVLMPLRVAPHAPADLVQALPGLERELLAALARHASFHAVSRAEIVELLGAAAQAQLTGCDEQSCMTQAANVLNADYLVVAQADARQGVWTFQASLLQRRETQPLRRAVIRARGLEALLGSLDALARQLAGAPSLSADDPHLALRLGTDVAGAAALQERLVQNGNADLVETWTALVVERNRESTAVAVTQSLMLLGAGAVAALGAGLAGVPVAMLIHFSPTRGGGGFAWPLALLAVATPVPFLAVALGLVLAAGASAWWDHRNPGRLRVAARGCCRDDVKVAQAARPSAVARVAALAAVAGGGCALASSSCFFCGNVVGQIVGVALGRGTAFPGPTVGVSDPVLYAGSRGLFTLMALGLLVVTLPAAAAAVAGGAIQLGTQYAPVVDMD